MAAQKHTGLGRGLGELFQQTTPAEGDEVRNDGMPEGSQFKELPIETITANPQQPRSVFDPDQLSELSESITEVGLLQPIVVRPLSPGRYELVMGERRLRASKLAGLTSIPAIIRPTEQEDLLRDALLENIQRVQLNPLEEAAAYQQLLSDFGCTQEELATRIKKSRPQISNTIRLLKLPTSVQKRVASGVLSAGHARALLGLPDPESMEKLAAKIVAEGMSVRATEEAVTLAESALPGEPSIAKKPKVAGEHPRAATIEAALSERYETRVQIKIGTRGKIIIEFAGEDDLDRILELMA
ncbi:MAG: ParB/RepB/Spo0J family partition protein [Propionibacteriaceae bacterium]|jgi:ParB family chromosome partitioning protein|nr:ParB/RepB/Spo0J family partition protein [Propionibacteriaceae bacterium]